LFIKTILPPRPSSVASSTSLNFGVQQRQQINQNSSSVIKPVVIGSTTNHHIPPPEPDKLMTYEQAMIYAHPALKDACKYYHFDQKKFWDFIGFFFSTFSSST